MRSRLSAVLGWGGVLVENNTFQFPQIITQNCMAWAQCLCTGQGTGWHQQQQLGSGEWGQAEHPHQWEHLGLKPACGWVTKHKAGAQSSLAAAGNRTLDGMGWFDFGGVQPLLPSTALV